MESIFGGLIEFDDSNDFDKFVQVMDKTEAITMLSKSIEYCQKMGIYNLTEANVLYKCLSKIKENENKN
jgi:hypothetical protein